MYVTGRMQNATMGEPDENDALSWRGAPWALRREGLQGGLSMIAWINIAVMIVASLMFLYYYMRSASPATLEKVLGSRAYERCARDRIVSMVFELVIAICYVVYFFYPLPIPLPRRFPWPWWVSVLIAIAIGGPSGTLMGIGLRDAGEEALRPKKDHLMYGGIYAKLRHPQAVGEVMLWWVFAFLLQSPFMAIFSFIYMPIFIMMCFAEEQDLLWRYGDAYAEYCRRVGAFWPRRTRGGG
jgi:protein-S-isoprenylcysteine O-methyltransferase Ste14